LGDQYLSELLNLRNREPSLRNEVKLIGLKIQHKDAGYFPPFY